MYVHVAEEKHVQVDVLYIRNTVREIYMYISHNTEEDGTSTCSRVNYMYVNKVCVVCNRATHEMSNVVHLRG